MSQVAIAKNHLAFVFAAVNRVINRTICLRYETLLITLLHCNIYFALKYPEKLCFLVNSIY